MLNLKNLLKTAVDAVSKNDLHNEAGQESPTGPFKLLRSYVPDELLTGLQNGEVWISEDLICTQLMKAQYEGVRVQGLSCSPQNLGIDLVVQRFKTIFNTTIKLRVESVCVQGDKQELTVSVQSIKVRGGNWLGQLMSPLATVIVPRGYAPRLIYAANNADVTVTQLQPDHFHVDLSRLPQLETLRRPVPLINKTPLDLIRIDACRHAEKGVFLKSAICWGNSEPQASTKIE